MIMHYLIMFKSVLVDLIAHAIDFIDGLHGAVFPFLYKYMISKRILSTNLFIFELIYLNLNLILKKY